MTASGAVLVACVALYAQAATVYAWLHLYGRKDAMSLSLAVTAAGATLFALGAAFLTLPVPPATAEAGARLLYAGAFVAVPSFLAASLTVAGVGIPRAPLGAFAGAMGLGALAAMLGFVHDGSDVVPAMGHEPNLSALGAVLVGIGLTGLLVALGVLAWAAPRRAGAKWMLIGASPGALAVLAEQLARLAGHRPAFALTYTGTLLMLVASWVLLRRFAAVGDALRAQRAALEASHAALLRAQRDRSRAEQLADVGELSVALAAEISRPMASLRRSIEHLDVEAVESGAARAVIDEIDAEASHLNALVSDLLTFARPPREERSIVVVSDLLQEAVQAVSHARHAAQTKLEVEAGLHVECEPESLRRAISHLLDNAATAANGDAVRVAAWREGPDVVRIDVVDSGEGMDTVVRKRAFEPFFTTRPYGTGLGLAIVARVVRAHRGTVEIESAHGRGTRVTVRLPAATKPPARFADVVETA